MERKNAFWLSFIFAMAFTCAPMLAQTAQQGDTPPPPKSLVQPPPPRPGCVEATDAQSTISGPYRVTYTLMEMDGTKRVGSQRYAVALDADARPSYINFQSSIPVEIGSSPGDSKKHRERMKAAMRIDTNLRQFANGMELSTQIGQDTFVNGANDATTTEEVPPITRQSFLTSTILLSENKPITIGQFDIPGSTHSLQIQVELTRVR